MTNCDDENDKLFIMDFIDGSVIPDPDSHASLPVSFLTPSGLGCSASSRYGRNDSATVRPRDCRELLLGAPFNQQVAAQSCIPSSISETARANDTGSERLLLASS